MLFIPATLTTYYITHPASYGTYLLVALVAGVGGGNFASSMANINMFYPQRLKGLALGLNAGGGNLGVTVIQLVGSARHRDGRQYGARKSCARSTWFSSPRPRCARR